MTADQEKILMNIDMRMRRIEGVLIGDPTFRVKGLAEKVEYHSKKIGEFDRDKTKIIAGASVLAAIAGFFSGFIHKYLN